MNDKSKAVQKIGKIINKELSYVPKIDCVLDSMKYDICEECGCPLEVCCGTQLKEKLKQKIGKQIQAIMKHRKNCPYYGIMYCSECFPKVRFLEDLLEELK